MALPSPGEGKKQRGLLKDIRTRACRVFFNETRDIDWFFIIYYLTERLSFFNAPTALFIEDFQITCQIFKTDRSLMNFARNWKTPRKNHFQLSIFTPGKK